VEVAVVEPAGGVVEVVVDELGRSIDVGFWMTV
jgi:hypothetical protein